jgi:hypothetical protein
MAFDENTDYSMLGGAAESLACGIAVKLRRSMDI